MKCPSLSYWTIRWTKVFSYIFFSLINQLMLQWDNSNDSAQFLFCIYYIIRRVLTPIRRLSEEACIHSRIDFWLPFGLWEPRNPIIFTFANFHIETFYLRDEKFKFLFEISRFEQSMPSIVRNIKPDIVNKKNFGNIAR